MKPNRGEWLTQLDRDVARHDSSHRYLLGLWVALATGAWLLFIATWKLPTHTPFEVLLRIVAFGAICYLAIGQKMVEKFLRYLQPEQDYGGDLKTVVAVIRFIGSYGISRINTAEALLTTLAYAMIASGILAAVHFNPFANGWAIVLLVVLALSLPMSVAGPFARPKAQAASVANRLLGFLVAEGHEGALVKARPKIMAELKELGYIKTLEALKVGPNQLHGVATFMEKAGPWWKYGCLAAVTYALVATFPAADDAWRDAAMASMALLSALVLILVQLAACILFDQTRAWLSQVRSGLLTGRLDIDIVPFYHEAIEVFRQGGYSVSSSFESVSRELQLGRLAVDPHDSKKRTIVARSSQVV